jgi:phage terminase Nu1 subunit (DNA packaging protein)
MNNANIKSVLVKKSELAKVFSVSPRTVDNWVAQRLIPYFATSPRMHLFDVSAVRKALAARFEVAARS